MKSRYQKQSEANERRRGSIKMYQKTIEKLSTGAAPNKKEQVTSLERKITVLERDIQNTENRMRSSQRF